MSATTKGAIQSALVSFGLAILSVGTTLFIAGVAAGKFGTPQSTWEYVQMFWWPTLIAAMIPPVYRVSQQIKAATTVVQGPVATSIPNALVKPELIPAIGTKVGPDLLKPAEL